MCGIAGIHLKDRHIGNPNIPVEELIDGLLLNIVKRGHHATGLCAVQTDGTVTVWKKDVEAKIFIELREWLPENTKTILLHTRYATKGDKEKNENNHPVIYKNCIAVHNGHINNDDALFKEYKMHRPAEVDSITIPMMVHRFGWENATEAFSKLQGACATAVVDKEHPGELWFARTYNSPLWVFEDRRFFMWASLREYVEDAWKKNYGTPPDKDKFRELDTYTAVRISDDKAVVEKFRAASTNSVGFGPRSNVQRGRPSEHGGSEVVRRQIGSGTDKQRYWWDYDEDGSYDPGGSGQRLRLGRDNLSEVSDVIDVIKCIECGNTHTKMNIKYMKDGTCLSSVVYTWDIPVCVRCITDANLVDYCDGFTYAHLGSRSIRFTATPKDDFPEDELRLFQQGEPWEAADDSDDECDSCHYFPSSCVGRNDVIICRSCLLNEFSKEAKVQIARNEERAKRLVVVNRGDKIPDDLLGFTGNCMVCEADAGQFISSEGLVVCDSCMKVDRLGQDPNSNTFGWCDSCETRFSKQYLQATIWGTMCDLCYRGQMPAEITKKDDNSTPEQREGQLKTAVHERACREAGHDLGYSPKFIEWIVTECSLQELQQMDMYDTYQDCRSAYDDASFVVEYLIQNDHDKLQEFPIPDGVWTAALETKEED